MTQAFIPEVHNRPMPVAEVWRLGGDCVWSNWYTDEDAAWLNAQLQWLKYEVEYAIEAKQQWMHGETITIDDQGIYTLGESKGFILLRTV